MVIPGQRLRPPFPAAITREQVENLETLCRSRGKAVAAVCRRFGVTSPEQMTVDAYEKAVAGLTGLPVVPAVRAVAASAS